ncbi:MAG: MMPL family transporter [Armatimonadetes bacterium]|nr:MMPL family transporter [Armatimonadota bacterium]
MGVVRRMTAAERTVTWSVDHPRTVIGITFLIALLFASQITGARTDTDPKNMLPPTSPVRVFNDQVDRWFGLYKDTLVLGVHRQDTVFHPDTLENIRSLSRRILTVPGVAARDLTSFTTVLNFTSQDGEVAARPILGSRPLTPGDIESLRHDLLSNPLLVGRIISSDGRTAAIYIPLEAGANGKAVADEVRRLLPMDGRETCAIAGDPIARDTFGAEMFTQMAVFAPIAGAIMFVVLMVMFRNLALVMCNMAVAMIAIAVSLGALVGAGYSIHIMSSMIPVFLMAISTDSVHIFNEFNFRYHELGDRRQAVLDTLKVVGRPIFFVDLTTAVGFASLALGPIVPVKVFGIFVAFGTMAILAMSFTFIPAVLASLSQSGLPQSTREANTATGMLASLARGAIRWRAAVLLVSLGLLGLSIYGITRIHVNNNMIAWFRASSDIRRSDELLNRDLGGTSVGYLVVSGGAPDAAKDPRMLKFVEGLQKDLQGLPSVGKTTSLADYVRRIHRVLHDNDPTFDAIPSDPAVVGQYLFLLQMSARPSDVNAVVDYPFRRINIWVQLKTWDAQAMRSVVAASKDYLRRHPLVGVDIQPAGMAQFNLVWNDEVLWGMLEGFVASTVLVLIILVVCFRSFRWGAVSFVPLLLTVVGIYGAVGLLGKDFDMPISVLSTLTLGLASDFAIQFVDRYRQRLREDPDVERALIWTAARPGRGIVRNAILFSVGFLVMTCSSLTPYVTVGVFMVAIMAISAGATLVLTPALVSLKPQWFRS